MKVRPSLLAFASMVAAACASGGRTAASDLPPAPAAIVEEDAALTTTTGNIAGTLELPAAKFPVPVVLIIAGSGPTDRNGNSAVIPGQNNSLKMLADGLAARGIATLRYDKRGIAGSRAAAAREDDLRFTHFIADASEWIRKLRADRRFSTITVAGHSEGSLIGMVAAREAGADGYVSIAGVGRKATEVLTEQLSAQLSPEVLAQTGRIMESIEQGREPDSVPPFLNALFRPSVRPYLRSWFAYSPTDEIARLTIPVLVIQGSTDVQVKVEDASRLAAARPGSKLVVVEGMNHVLKTARGNVMEQMPSYSNPALPVVPIVIDEIAGFVKALRETRGPRVGDSIFGVDKLMHFLLAGFVESVAFAGLQAAGAERNASLAGAGAATFTVSVGRELHDRRVSGLFSVGDLVWDALGAGAAFLILARVQK